MSLNAMILVSLLSQNPIPVVVSTDCGCEMDDQWAIAHLCLSTTIDVRAIVTAHAPKFAPPAAETSANTARRVLGGLPIKKKPPVVAGSNGPLRDRRTPTPSVGVDRLLAESKGFTSDRRLTVVQIGPATDIASALLIDPTFADRVSVVAMAFDGWPDGGDPFNVRNDVAAWQVLIESKTPITIVDGAVSRRDLTMTRQRAAERFGSQGPAGSELVGYLKAWLDRRPELARSITGSAEAWPVWDCGTVAVVLGLAKWEVSPRPHLRDDLSFDHARPVGTIRWVTSIDSERLWTDLAEKLVRRD